jgi:hypothetical protein
MGKRKFRRDVPGLPIDDCVLEGRRIAGAARWLLAVNWEERLAEPLEALRAELGLRPPGLYFTTRANWPREPQPA